MHLYEFSLRNVEREWYPSLGAAMLSLLIQRKENRGSTHTVRPIGGSYYDNALPLASCGGQDTTSTGEKEAREEEVAEEAPVESLPSSEPGPNMDTEVCQTGEALEKLEIGRASCRERV